eukprot:NODE_1433_length_970_cov_85.412595_g988_i0.p2 GENE.NODE_1433_length_970_cov_85.412595_g988_i0~~NODE_1433_length_970_cov_85.412595_g988_i0.p2  ORF type:complete len:217 (-),score=87.54 NODE_1433_length_970_cov_85.412595_g988_i0:318-935(-)
MGAALCQEKEFVPLLDSAYQGYATGNLENDSYGARLFEKLGLEFAVAQSYSKNMGLYGERVGCLSFVCHSAEDAARLGTQLKVIVRPWYSNPPLHGARIVHHILTNPARREEWTQELSGMSQRIRNMREMLFSELQRLEVPGQWGHIVKQIGMFSYSGLTAPQCEALIKDHHVYLLKNGRISIAGLSANRIPYLAEAIKAVVTKN